MKKMWLLFIILCEAVSGNVTVDTTSDVYLDYNSSVKMSYTDSYSTLEFALENDCNSSICSNSTTTKAPLLTTIPIRNILKNIHHDFSGTPCLCNLHRNICDINCCCDEDCNYEKKKIFDHCDSVDSSNIDRRLCTYVEHDYVNFSLHEWEIQNNDLFCVVRSNVPPSRTIQKEELLDNYEESLLERDSRYDWPERISNIDKHINYSTSYSQGLPIWMILENSTIDSFKISESLISSGCNIQTEVEYLYDVHSECVHAVNERNIYLNFDFYNQFLFVAKPNNFNYTKLRNKLLTCTEPTCLKPNMKICADINLRNCRDNNKTDLSFRCEYSEEETTCENVVKSIKYIFYHEGIKGLKQINVSTHLVNIAYKSTKQHELEQSISIEFQWAESPTNFSNILGGNPGYLVKRPILIGMSINGTTSRNPQNYGDNFMVLPDEDMGECSIGKYSYQPIEFGYDTILTCKIRVEMTIQKIFNATDVCKQIQLEVFKYWSIRELGGIFMNKTFGYFGNANLSITEDWKEIIYEKSPQYIRDHILGKYENKTKTLNCAGLAHGLDINIYHARVDLKKLVDQEKILGITHKFQSIHNEKISINSRQTNYEFMLDTRVKFWDVTSPKVRKSADSPSLNIKLPSDFFYPFVKVGNGCNVCIVNNFFVLCLIIISGVNVL